MKSQLVCLGLASLASATIIGVSPAEQHLYEPTLGENGQKLWACLSNPSIVLRYDQINDDYCDCPDGSDEPGTNACPVGASKPFYCANEGHFPAYIDNFKVNDGACDYDVCCDGSDEYVSGICPNKCAEVHQQYEEYVETHLREVEQSQQQQQQLKNQAQSYVGQVKKHVAALRGKSSTKQGEVADLEAKLERARTQGTASGPSTAFDHLSDSISSIKESLTRYATEKEASGLSIKSLEAILADLIANYNPNFNDAAVKSAVNKFQDYISNKQPEPQHDASSLEVLGQLAEKARALSADATPSVIPSFANMISYYYTKIFNFLHLDEEHPADGPVSNDVTAKLEQEIQATNKAIKDLTTEIEIFEEDLKSDYGPDSMLRALRTVSVNKKLGDYNYKIGILDGVYQDQTVVGRFSHYKDGKIYYLDGQKCWNGPRRQAVVQLLCGSTHEILSGAELERCEYYIELSSPIVCSKLSDDQLKETFQIDHDRL